MCRALRPLLGPQGLAHLCLLRAPRQGLSTLSSPVTPSLNFGIFAWATPPIMRCNLSARWRLILGARSHGSYLLHLVLKSPRFHDIAWVESPEKSSKGIIAGALESGSLDLWDAQKLTDGEKYFFSSQRAGLPSDSRIQRLCIPNIEAQRRHQSFAVQSGQARAPCNGWSQKRGISYSSLARKVAKGS